MANTIKIKNTGTASATPSQLEYGELAINYADGKLFYRNSSNEIVIYGSSSSLSGTTYSATIGDGTATSFTLTHNLGTRDIFVAIRSATTPYDEIEALWEATSTTTATIKFDTPPANGSVRVSIYAAVTGDSISLNLDGLTDVSVSSPLNGQVLKYNGSYWVNDTDDAGTTINSIGDIGDVLITSATPGQVLKFNGSEWVNDTDDAGTTINSIGDIGDVNFAIAPTEGQTLVFDGTNWFNSNPIQSPSGSLYTQVIGNGSDTSFVINHNLGTRDVFVAVRENEDNYENLQVAWEATSLSAITINFGTPPSSNSVKVLVYSSVSGDSINMDLNGLDDVVITSATPGQIIAWDGSQWINTNTVEDLVIQGDLTVNGTTTTINTQNLLVEDNLITLNSNAVAATSNAGIEVERGDSDNVQIRWNEETDKWQFTNDGTTFKDLGSGGVTVSDTIPFSPAEGDMWYESDTGGLFAYYDSHWIEIGGSAAYDQIIGTIQAKGDLLAGNGSQSLVRLPAGSNGKRLSANSSTATGLEWIDDTQNSVVDAKGDLLVGFAADSLMRLPVGQNGQVLMANSLTASGLWWSNPPSNRNVLINGSFKVDQRGRAASHTVTAGSEISYTVDRWYEYCTGANVTASRQNYLPVGGGVRNPLYSYQFTGASGNTGIGFGQRIESINTSSEGIYTLSCIIWSNASKVITWTAYAANSADSFGTLASPTRTQLATGTFTTSSLSSNPVVNNRFSAYFANNSINGIEIVFTCSSLGSGETLNFANIQLEAGLTATPFEQKNYGIELIECRRYFWAKPASQTAITSMQISGFGTYAVVPLNVLNSTEMRIVPTPTTDPAFPLASYPPYIADNNSNLRTITAFGVYANGAGIRFDYSSTALSNGTIYFGNWGDPNRTLWLSAEL